MKLVHCVLAALVFAGATASADEASPPAPHFETLTGDAALKLYNSLDASLASREGTVISHRGRSSERLGAVKVQRSKDGLKQTVCHLPDDPAVKPTCELSQSADGKTPVPEYVPGIHRKRIMG